MLGIFFLKTNVQTKLLLKVRQTTNWKIQKTENNYIKMKFIKIKKIIFLKIKYKIKQIENKKYKETK